MKRANTMSTITVELILKMKTKFTSSNAEKTNGFISPQMSDIFSQMSYFHTIGPGEPRDTARSPKDVRKHKRGCDMRSNPTCQHTPTRGYQGTVLIHGSLGTGAFSNSPALYTSFTSPRTLSGPPPPVRSIKSEVDDEETPPEEPWCPPIPPAMDDPTEQEIKGAADKLATMMSSSQPSTSVFYQPDPHLWLQAKLTISLTSMQEKFARLFMSIAFRTVAAGRD